MPKKVASVKTISTIVGSGKSSRMTSSQAESNKGYLDIVFKDFEERNVSSYKTMAWLEDTLPQLVPGWKLQVIKQAMGPPTGKPVELEISGDDYQQLSVLADSIKNMIQKVPGLTNATHDYDPGPAGDPGQRGPGTGQTARIFHPRRGLGRARRHLRKRSGKIPRGQGRIQDHGPAFAGGAGKPATGSMKSSFRKTARRRRLPSVATITQGANIASIKHVDGKRTIQVTAELAPGQKDERGPKKLAMAAVKKIRPPLGYTIRPGSGNRMQAESQGFLVKAFFIAMGLVFLTMVFQFNSLFQPFLILIGILLSLGGVFWGLLITNKFSAFVNFITAAGRTSAM